MHLSTFPERDTEQIRAMIYILPTSVKHLESQVKSLDQFKQIESNLHKLADFCLKPRSRLKYVKILLFNVDLKPAGGRGLPTYKVLSVDCGSRTILIEFNYCSRIPVLRWRE